MMANIPEEFRFEQSEIVRPSVIMHPLEVPCKGDPVCNSYEDIIGVLNGYKRVSIVLREHFVPGTPPNPEHSSSIYSCAKRPVHDWIAWKTRLFETCHASGLVVWSIPEKKDSVLVFHETSATYAALLYICIFSPGEMGLFFDNVSDMNTFPYIAGKLMGYNERDIESWYLRDALAMMTSCKRHLNSSDKWWGQMFSRNFTKHS